jgi:hypothetical protein
MIIPFPKRFCFQNPVNILQPREAAASSFRDDRDSEHSARQPLDHDPERPDITVDVREVFGIDIDMKVPAFSVADERVPDRDDTYVFDPDTTLAILADLPLTAA